MFKLDQRINSGLTDNQLITRIQNNDEKAFEDIFRRYFQVLNEYAVFYTEDPQLSEDIVQDIFLKLWHSRHKISIHTTLKGYLYRSVHNRCIQYLRHKAVEQQHKDSHQAKLQEAILMNRLFFENGITRLFESEIKLLIQKSLDELPEKTREIYILSRKRYLTNKEIAKKKNISEKSVEYHISKVMESLRKYLRDYIPLLIIAQMIFIS